MRRAVPGCQPSLTAGDCQVWWARLHQCAPWHEQLLDPAERRRRDRYLRSADRDRFTLGVALSRMVIGKQLGADPAELVIDRACARCGEPHGRPRLAGVVPLSFSVSHSGELVAVAIASGAGGGGAPRRRVGAGRGGASRRSVGVDVERAGPLPEPSLLGMVLSAAERAVFDRLDAAGRAAAFFRTWVRKEAVLKATGEGLSVPLRDITIGDADGRPRLREWAGRPAAPEAVAVHDLEALPGYAASVALVGGDASVFEKDATELLAAS